MQFGYRIEVGVLFADSRMHLWNPQQVARRKTRISSGAETPKGRLGKQHSDPEQCCFRIQSPIQTRERGDGLLLSAFGGETGWKGILGTEQPKREHIQPGISQNTSVHFLKSTVSLRRAQTQDPLDPPMISNAITRSAQPASSRNNRRSFCLMVASGEPSIAKHYAHCLHAHARGDSRTSSISCKSTFSTEIKALACPMLIALSLTAN